MGHRVHKSLKHPINLPMRLEDFRNDVSFKGYQAKGHESQQGKGGGVINSEKWPDVIYGWPLREHA